MIPTGARWDLFSEEKAEQFVEEAEKISISGALIIKAGQEVEL